MVGMRRTAAHCAATRGSRSATKLKKLCSADRHYVNSPLLHINPKGWTDMYRFPKYVYYLWQANFTAKPMAYILPHYWREEYLGQRKPIVVDSNCESVTLKVNGETIGTAQP